MIVLIGLGAGDSDTLSRGAERALRDASAWTEAGAGALILRTARHPVVDTLRGWGLAFESFDALYDTASDFSSLYADIAARILAQAQNARTDGGTFDVAFAVPGHPRAPRILGLAAP